MANGWSAINDTPRHSSLTALRRQSAWFAGPAVRNAAAASPVSDLMYFANAATLRDAGETCVSTCLHYESGLSDAFQTEGVC